MIIHIYKYLYLSISISIYLYLSLSISIYVYLFISIYQSLSIYLFVYLGHLMTPATICCSILSQLTFAHPPSSAKACRRSRACDSHPLRPSHIRPRQRWKLSIGFSVWLSSNFQIDLYKSKCMSQRRCGDGHSTLKKFLLLWLLPAQ
jgi:hypothetical protein